MKLFYYDVKHNQIMNEKDLGELSPEQVELVNKVISFLDDSCLTDGRYKNVCLAEDVEVQHDDGEPYLVIRDAR